MQNLADKHNSEVVKPIINSESSSTLTPVPITPNAVTITNTSIYSSSDFPVDSDGKQDGKASSSNDGYSKSSLSANQSRLDTSKVRRTNRISKSCYSCKKRKVKCNFEIPCDRCIARNRAHLCSREPIIVDGLLVNTGDEIELKFSQENEVLKRKIKELEETVMILKKVKKESGNNHVLISDGEANEDGDGEEYCNDDNSDNSSVHDRDADDGNNNSDDIQSNDNENNETNKDDTNLNKPNKSRRLSQLNKSRDRSDPNVILLNSNMDSNNNSLNKRRRYTTSQVPRPDDLIKSKKWDSYSIIISLLTKGLANGLVENDDDKNCNGNTEEWSRMNSKTLIQGIEKDEDQYDIWNYQLKLVQRISKRDSDFILKRAFQVNFMHNVIDKEGFMKQYEDYWYNEIDPEKHISPFYSKSNQKYLLLSQYYALLCLGIYYSDDTLQEDLNFSDEEWDFFPRVFFACALECLNRGRYMTYPNMSSIQAFLLLKLCTHGLGGVNLQNCLFGIMCYNARKLHIDKINAATSDLKSKETQLKMKCWWGLVNVDWYESLFRYSLIAKSSFSTPLPNKWLIEKQVINWENYYQLFLTKISTIKKNYYYEDEVSKNEISLESLKKADLELRILEVETKKDFEMYMDNDKLNRDETFSTTIEFTKFSIDFTILHERLDVNSKMSRFMKYEEWTQQCYQTCYNCAKGLILKYASPETPNLFRKPWFVPECALSAALFLLVDCMLNKQIIRYQKETIILVKKIIPVLGSYKQVMRPALRGIYVLQKLIDFMLGGDKDNSINALREFSRRSHPDSRAKVRRRRAPKIKREPLAFPSGVEGFRGAAVFLNKTANEPTEPIDSAVVGTAAVGSVTTDADEKKETEEKSDVFNSTPSAAMAQSRSESSVVKPNSKIKEFQKQFSRTPRKLQQLHQSQKANQVSLQRRLPLDRSFSAAMQRPTLSHTTSRTMQPQQLSHLRSSNKESASDIEASSSNDSNDSSPSVTYQSLQKFNERQQLQMQEQVAMKFGNLLGQGSAINFNQAQMSAPFSLPNQDPQLQLQIQQRQYQLLQQQYAEYFQRGEHLQAQQREIVEEQSQNASTGSNNSTHGGTAAATAPIAGPSSAQVHTTILDILSDNGWEQFLDTIDDFAMTFDV